MEKLLILSKAWKSQKLSKLLNHLHILKFDVFPIYLYFGCLQSGMLNLLSHPCQFQAKQGKISKFLVVFFEAFALDFIVHMYIEICANLTGSLFMIRFWLYLFWFSTYTELNVEREKITSFMHCFATFSSLEFFKIDKKWLVTSQI